MQLIKLTKINLSGYTEESPKSDHPDYDLVKSLVDAGMPVIAEGKIHSPEQLKKMIEVQSRATTSTLVCINSSTSFMVGVI